MHPSGKRHGFLRKSYIVPSADPSRTSVGSEKQICEGANMSVRHAAGRERSPINSQATTGETNNKQTGIEWGPAVSSRYQNQI